MPLHLLCWRLVLYIVDNFGHNKQSKANTHWQSLGCNLFARSHRPFLPLPKKDPEDHRQNLKLRACLFFRCKLWARLGCPAGKDCCAVPLSEWAVDVQGDWEGSAGDGYVQGRDVWCESSWGSGIFLMLWEDRTTRLKYPIDSPNAQTTNLDTSLRLAYLVVVSPLSFWSHRPSWQWTKTSDRQAQCKLHWRRQLSLPTWSTNPFNTILSLLGISRNRGRWFLL